MKRLILGIVSITLFSTMICAACVSQITAASYNNKISGSDQLFV